MPLTLPTFAELDPAVVEQFHAQAVTAVEEDNPRLDAGRGVLGEIVLWLHALLAGQTAQAAAQYERVRSLLAISESPGLASAADVDHVLGHFRITRKPGIKARGDVTLVVDGNAPVVIAAGAVFTGNGKRFVTEAAYAGKPSQALLASDTDRLLRPIGSNRFAFDIPVVAETEGTGYELRRGSLVVPQVNPPGYVTSYALADFTSGANVEANADMLRRLQEGLAAKTPSNRVCLQAMLRDASQFSRVIRTSAVGFGDAAQHRDRYWLFPISGGGRVDWYIRSTETPERRLLTKTATRVAGDGDPTMQLTISRDDFPGYYEITAVRTTATADGLGSLAIVSEARSLNLGADGPDVRGLVDGDYSAYTVSVLRFTDPAGPSSVGGTADYVIEIVGMPLIAEIQNYMTARVRDGLLSDLLIRAAVPCFVKVGLAIDAPPTAGAIDLAAVRSAVAAAVNATDFIGRLYGSRLIDAAYNVLPSDAKVARIDLLGRFRYPGGQSVIRRSPELLIAPDAPAACVTEATVQFFCYPDDVEVAVTAVGSVD